MATMVEIRGNTYPVRGELRAMGGRWDSRSSAWYVPESVADAARSLVAPSRPQASRPRVDISAVVDLLRRAGEHLRFPKIRLETPAGTPVVLSLAGDRSRYPGTVNVSTGEPYGTPGSWHGRINLDGTHTVTRGDVVALLTELAERPAETAAKYGRATGNCCFCGRPLTNGAAGSASVGYGPICAERFGLPWDPNGKTWEFAEGHDVYAVS